LYCMCFPVSWESKYRNCVLQQKNGNFRLQ
jgi:hypothetical protein